MIRDLVIGKLVTTPPSNSQSPAQPAVEPEALSADAKGRAGEASAKAWLQAQGYQVLAERFRRRNGVAGEIDLIVMRDATLSFVEVKSHQSETAALEAITARARARIAAAAEVWLAENPSYSSYPMRFDLVLVSAKQEIAIIENAWQLDD